jgi:hypothetical protein
VGELVAGELPGESSRLFEPFRFSRYTNVGTWLSWCRVFLRHGHEKKPECRIINGLPRWRRNCCNIKLAIGIDSASIN